jgi:hypothetical protein
MNRDAGRERQRRRRVAQDVKGARRDPGRLAAVPEPFGEALRMDRRAELVGEHEIGVDVGIAREVPLEQLGVAMPAMWSLPTARSSKGARSCS